MVCRTEYDGLIPAVGYLRRSSDNESQEDSIPQ